MKSSMMSRVSAAFVTAASGILILSLFTSTPEVAAKGKSGGGGGAENNYDVYVDDDVSYGWPDGPPSSLYAPGIACPGDTPGGAGNYFVAMLDDGDTTGGSCGIVQLYDLGETIPNRYELRDEVGIMVRTRKSKGKSYFTGIALVGQNEIGPDSYWHKSVEIPLVQEVPVPTDPSTGFTLHVHSTALVQRYDSHLSQNNGVPAEDVGYVSIGDLVYNPQ